MKSNAKIVIGLLQVNADPWKRIYQEGQLPTWVSTCSENIDIVNIFGNPPSRLIRVFDKVHENLRWSPIFQGPIHLFDKKVGKKLSKFNEPKWKLSNEAKASSIHVKFPSTHLSLPNVEISFFKYFLNCTSADFLYMSNTSSYVNTKNLEIFINELDKKAKIYGGTMNEFAGITYASGSNRLISRNLVCQIVNNFENWDFSLVEDVSMGKILQNESFTKVHIPSLSFNEFAEIKKQSYSQISSAIHFRLKSGSLKSRNDVELMHLIHNKLGYNFF